MDQPARDQILTEAKRIADELLSNAETGPNGLFFRTQYLVDTKRNYDWMAFPDIYSGSAGIALFLMELYKQTGEEKYYQGAADAIKWSVHQCIISSPPMRNSFYDGKGGCIYALLQLYKVRPDPALKTTAMELFDQMDFSLPERPVCDLLSGVSGELLALLHLYEATGEERILPVIDNRIAKLLSTAHPGNPGIYWDRNSSQHKGVSGFSHGSGGIAFALLEAGRYFGNSALSYFAEQAFLYENKHYDAAKKNWPDLRVDSYSEEKREKMMAAARKKDRSIFTAYADFAAWCNGAPGIGLTRLRAQHILEKEVYKKDLAIAIEKTISASGSKAGDDKLPSPTLCHGNGGNLTLLLEAYKLSQDPELLSEAEAGAVSIAASRQEQRAYTGGFFKPDEDYSLFNGNAGVGYFYLQALEPMKVSSVLCPYMDAPPATGKDFSAFPHISIAQHAVRKKITTSAFPRTIGFLDQHAPQVLENYFHSPADGAVLNEFAAFPHYVKEQAASFPLARKQCVLEILGLEARKLEMDEQACSNSMSQFQTVIKRENAERILKLETDAFYDLQLQLTEGSELLWVNYNWQLPVNENTEAGKYSILLFPTAFGTDEHHLNTFTYFLLSQFCTARKVSDVISLAVKAVNANSAEKIKEVEMLAAVQVKKLIDSLFLEESPQV